jgi:hypothetical protein
MLSGLDPGKDSFNRQAMFCVGIWIAT